MKRRNNHSSRFEPTPLFDRIASRVTRIAGSSYASIVAFLLIVVWAVTGPIFNFSDTWQLVINTGTTIITFLMVFIIQQTQNKDTIALQLKLNELIACNEKASNRLIDIESLTEEELEIAHHFYVRLAKLAEKERDLYGTHSLDDANENHETKMGAGNARKNKKMKHAPNDSSKPAK
jgi:low affinity Fe/Cu permease